MRLDEMLYDPEGWQTLVQAWWETRAGKVTRAGHLYQIAKENQLLNGLTYASELSEKKRLGWRMRQQAGKTFGGFRIIRTVDRCRVPPEYLLEKVG